ncbi:hypothetical protein CPter291_1791 [Collimonas pratensis]|uniref:Uncharacterized protein n=1 Tax=Collimonas pratensis TaxID=279113 RepID=A0A127QVU8_9BURK|nr:hypothetical protein CPter91_1753 [Collimonas pratensis]AMP14057.1 hypothetical protein CPter291_1791 [Collimonas pratensis]
MIERGGRLLCGGHLDCFLTNTFLHHVIRQTGGTRNVYV